MGKASPPSKYPAGIYILDGVPGIPQYQRGHLVAGSTANSLGGPGDDVRNLVPLAQASNREMRDKPEKVARDLISDKTAHPPYLLNYTVRCEYLDMVGFQSELKSMSAGANAAENLFRLARANTPLTPPAIQTAFDNPTRLLAPDEVLNVRKRLAYYFMPVRLWIDIAPVQGPLLNKRPPFEILNHQPALLD